MSKENKVYKPLITVAICTYNRASILEKCLDSLFRQTVSLDQFDILIVNNNSTDNTKEITTAFCERTSNARVLFEPSQGLSHARNRALAEAHSTWIVFLDDDAKAHPNWLAEIFETIKKDDFDAFGGPFYAWHFWGPAPSWFPEDFGTYEAAQPYGPLIKGSYIPGGNCAFRLSAAQAVGCFPVHIGMSGKKCAYGEETLMFDRMKKAGFRLGYVPAMKIDHCVLPYKYSFSWQIKSAFARGRGLEQVEPQQHRHAVLKLFYVYLKMCWLITKDTIAPKKDYSWRAMVLHHFFTPICYSGLMFEKFKKVLCKWLPK